MKKKKTAKDDNDDNNMCIFCVSFSFCVSFFLLRSLHICGSGANALFYSYNVWIGYLSS